MLQQDVEEEVAPKPSLSKAIAARAAAVAQEPQKVPLQIGFKKDRKKPTPTKRRKRPEKELLHVIRNNRSCLLALGVDDSVKDIVIIQALMRVDEKASFFRCAGCPPDVAQQIEELFEAGQRELAELSTGFLLRAWYLVLRGLLLVLAIFVLGAFVVWFSTLDWVRGKCNIADFSNGTCHQENGCLLQIATQTDEGIAYVNNFAIPVVAGRETNANGLKVFEGAFSCCNFAQQAQATDNIPEVVSTDVSSGQGFGSGTPCCNFYNDRYKIFCDNFGLVQQFAHCPKSPWACRLFSELNPETGRPEITKVQVWVEPFTVVLVVCAIAVLVLVFMVIGFGYACKHSERLYMLGLRMAIAGERLQRRVNFTARMKSCRLRVHLCCRRALRLPTHAQDRALRREEKMRQLAQLIEQRLREEEEEEIKAAQGSGPDAPRNLQRGAIQQEIGRQAEKDQQRKRVVAKELRKMFRQSRRKKSSNLKILENDGKLDSLPRTRDPASTGDSFYSASSYDLESEDPEEAPVQPWTDDLVEEEDREPTSRPATKHVQSMLRPIMTPMQPRRSPKVSKKFGLQDLSSTTTSFAATATSFPSSYGTELGANSFVPSASPFNRGDSMAQTFSEGFARKKRRVQDGKSRRWKARMAWQDVPRPMDVQSDSF